MVGNLSSVYINNQSSNSYSRIYLANDGVKARFNQSEQHTHSRSDGVQSTHEKLNSVSHRNKTYDSSDFHNSKQFEDVLQRFQKRTVLFQMMETMGGTGTNDSMSGQFLDTYV